MACCPHGAHCRDYFCCKSHPNGRTRACPLGSTCSTDRCYLLHPPVCQACVQTKAMAGPGATIDTKSTRKQLADAFARRLIEPSEFELLLQRLATTCPCACGLVPTAVPASSGGSGGLFMASAVPKAELEWARSMFADWRAACTARAAALAAERQADHARVADSVGSFLRQWVADKFCLPPCKLDDIELPPQLRWRLSPARHPS